MLKKFINITLLFCISFSYFAVLPTKTSAADFVLSIDRIYEVSDTDSTLHITESRTVSNYSSNYYIPASSTEEFTIQNFKEGLDEEELNTKLDSISVTNGYGNSLTYEIEQDGEDIKITALYPTAIRKNQSLVFRLRYDSTELVETVGKIKNAYIPGFGEDYQEYVTDEDTGTISQIIYNTSLLVPKSLGEASFTLPEPTDISENTEYTTYSFDTESLINKSVWHQIGTQQYYHFKITQPSDKTDYFTPEKLDFISKNQFKIILPRDYSETNQQVYFTNISPKPENIEIDDDGNVIATFLTNATENEEIIVEGYITVELNGIDSKDLTTAQNATLSDISDYSDMDRYLKAAEYWEVDNTSIQAKAKELMGESKNILEILQKDYEFIVDSIDYDEFKYGSVNQRQGALKTLNGGSSVCMEYSDLLITLARSQGIPARAAYGYGYDPKLKPDEQEDHQWVQAWIPQYGWLTIDPTWGETGREFIGKDLDHALWYVASEHPNVPSQLSVLSADSDIEIKSSIIEINAVDSLPEESELNTLSDIKDEIDTKNTTINQISRKFQTSMLGRAAIIVVPLTLTVIIITAITSAIIRKIRGPKIQQVPRPSA